MSERKVARVLVMLDYGPGDPNSGEVFDLTAIAKEMLPQSSYSADIGITVKARKAYLFSQDNPPETVCQWSGYAGGQLAHGAVHPADVVNMSLPDNPGVKRIRSKIKALDKKRSQLEHEAMKAKLEQVAAIRHQHPIGTIKMMPPTLETAT